MTTGRIIHCALATLLLVMTGLAQAAWVAMETFVVDAQDNTSLETAVSYSFPPGGTGGPYALAISGGPGVSTGHSGLGNRSHTLTCAGVLWKGHPGPFGQIVPETRFFGLNELGRVADKQSYYLFQFNAFGMAFDLFLPDDTPEDNDGYVEVTLYEWQ